MPEGVIVIGPQADPKLSPSPLSNPEPTADRASNGAATNPTWEPAREIFDPGTQNGTISNQIIPLPDGSLVDGFYLFKTNQNNQGTRGNSVAVGTFDSRLGDQRGYRAG